MYEQRCMVTLSSVQESSKIFSDLNSLWMTPVTTSNISLWSSKIHLTAVVLGAVCGAFQKVSKVDIVQEIFGAATTLCILQVRQYNFSLHFLVFLVKTCPFSL